jgi:flavorubredoxin
MDKVIRVGDVSVLPTHLDIPGAGTLLVNSYVLHAQQPMLIDAGLAFERDSFVDTLRSVIDPAELRWVWLTHDDNDHTGNLEAIMDLAPDAELVTHALGALRMSTWWPVPLERVHAVSLGEQFDVGDRTLRALRPPTFDNPMSTGIFDERTRTLFSVDSFGALLPNAVESIDDLTSEQITGGMIGWATFDAPWLHYTDVTRFGRAISELRQLDPSCIFSSHLPAATGRLEAFIDILAAVPDADPFVAPDAAAFRQIAAALRAAVA